MATLTKTKKKPWDRGARERLLTGASRLFARKGYAAATVREIVQEAGVSKPVLYYYFKNKEGPYLDLMREALARFDALLEESRQHRGSVRERLILLSERIFGLFMEQIEVARLAYSIYFGPSQGAPSFDFEALHLKFRQVLMTLVEEGIGNQEIKKKNVLDITIALLGVINVAMELKLGHPELHLGKKELRRVLNLLFEGLAREKETIRGKKG